jgi:hypothetical protein
MPARTLKLVLSVVVGIGMCAPTLFALPAAADAPSGRGDHVGWTDGAGVGARASQTVTEEPRASGGGGRLRGGGTVACTYMKLPPEEAALGDALAASGEGAPRGPGPGTWYAKMCTDTAANVSTGTVVWVPDPAPTSPATLAEEALRYAPIPLPGIGMNPSPERDQLVRVPVWLWVDPAGWAPVSTSASAGGVTVTVRAVPERVVWDMGNGDTVVCGSGTPYDPARRPDAQSTDCSYTYQRSSASQPGQRYQVTATAEWHASWSVSGGRGGGDLGVVRRSSNTSLRVAEAQAINTSPST